MSIDIMVIMMFILGHNGTVHVGVVNVRAMNNLLCYAPLFVLAFIAADEYFKSIWSDFGWI